MGYRKLYSPLEHTSRNHEDLSLENRPGQLPAMMVSSDSVSPSYSFQDYPGKSFEFFRG